MKQGGDHMTAMFLAMVTLSVVAGLMSRVTLSPSRVRFKPVLHVRLRRSLSKLVILTLLLPGLASAHGKVAMEEDSCVQRVGGNLVHFNAYQPQNEATAQYCTEIPGEGETFLVVDLVDPGLRTMPVGVR